MKFPLRSAFLAIPLEGDAKWHFQALQESLRPWEPFLRFQRPGSPHLTLYFWPEVYQIEYGPIVDAARKIAAQAEQFELRLNGVGTFGDKSGDKVLYLTAEFSPQLADLKKRCPWLNPPGKPFHPHVTLARIDHPQRFEVEKKKILKALGDVGIVMTVDRARLYAQIDGRKQTPIEEFPFA